VSLDADSDGLGIQELCERLLAHPHPEGPTSVELLVRRLPEWLASDIALLSDWRLLGSALYTRAGRPTLLEAVIDAPSAFAEFVIPFEDAVVASGWAVLAPTGPMHGGFMSADLGEGRAFRRGESGPVLSIRGIGREGMATDVRLRLDWEAADSFARMAQMRPDGSERMPLLRAPAGVRISGQHGGGGSGHWTSESTVQTDRSVTEMEAHFAEQLVQAGWRRVGGSANGTVGWSSWQLPGDGGWRGLLLVLAAFRRGEHSLTLRVEQDERSDEAWSSHVVSSHST
jgi:hypothetical protein